MFSRPAPNLNQLSPMLITEKNKPEPPLSVSTNLAGCKTGSEGGDDEY